MKTSRLRSNFSRKHSARIRPRRTKRTSRFRRRKTRYITHKNKRRIMRGGAPNFKKVNLYNAYDQPVEEISYSTPMQWDD